MIRIKPFEMSDLYEFKQNGHFYLENMGEALSANLKDPRMMMMSLYDDKTYAIIGFNTLRAGTVEAFLIPHRDMGKKAKGVITALNFLLEKRNIRLVGPRIHRVEMAVKASERKWAKALGFEFEGLTKFYDGKEHHFRFVRFY